MVFVCQTLLLVLPLVVCTKSEEYWDKLNQSVAQTDSPDATSRKSSLTLVSLVLSAALGLLITRSASASTSNSDNSTFSNSYVPVSFILLASQIISNLLFTNIDATSPSLAYFQYLLINVMAQLCLATSVLVLQRQVVTDMFGRNSLSDSVGKMMAFSIVAAAGVCVVLLRQVKDGRSLQRLSESYI